METFEPTFRILLTIVLIMIAVSTLGADEPEQPVRPRHEHPDEVNPPLDGRAIAGYVSSTSTRAASDGRFLLADLDTTAHPLWDRDVDG